MTFDTIFFIGPQGSGKGTQAKALAERLGFFYWEMGAILRQEALKTTDLGRSIAELINKGYLVDDETLFRIVEDEFSSIPSEGGIIFDGIPRRIAQAEFLFKYLEQRGHNRFLTFHIDLTHEQSIERLLERAHHEFRQDDTRDAIAFRLEQYDKETLPVLDFMREHSTFVTIDGAPAREEVTRAIDEALTYVQASEQQAA